jgi:hypothetical protein
MSKALSNPAVDIPKSTILPHGINTFEFLKIMIKKIPIFGTILVNIHRRFIPNPMRDLLKELKKRRVKLKELKALELFGKDGLMHTKDYASKISSLEIWEINPQFEDKLKANLPMAEIKITDSYEEIKKTTKKYNFIVIDNPMSSHGEYFEHFAFFPHIFNVAMDSTILIANIIPEVSEDDVKKYPYLFNKQQLDMRKSFYETNQPEKIPIEKMVETYEKHAQKYGFFSEWYFVKKRNFIYYLILKIKKSKPGC